VVTLFNLLPRRLRAARLLDSSFALDLWLRVLVLSNKMLKEIITTITLVMTGFNIASPPLKLPMSFVFVSDPIGFALEHLWPGTFVPGASEWLNIFMDVLSPVRWFHELLGSEAKSALKLSWKVRSWRHWNILREALGIDSTFNWRSIILIVWGRKRIQLSYVLILVQQGSRAASRNAHYSRVACSTKADMSNLVFQ
jgi:hypothetical protein